MGTDNERNIDRAQHCIAYNVTRTPMTITGQERDSRIFPTVVIAKLEEPMVINNETSAMMFNNFETKQNMALLRAWSL